MSRVPDVHERKKLAVHPSFEVIGGFNAISNLTYGWWVIVDYMFYIMIIMKGGTFPLTKLLYVTAFE